ncbi:unnamed protein product, partial [Rotaria sp. Silwood2]
GDPPRPEVRNLELPRNYAFPGHQPVLISIQARQRFLAAGSCR